MEPQEIDMICDGCGMPLAYLAGVTFTDQEHMTTVAELFDWRLGEKPLCRMCVLLGPVTT
jgi:hypothetical protein